MTGRKCILAFTLIRWQLCWLGKIFLFFYFTFSMPSLRPHKLIKNISWLLKTNEDF